MNDEEREREHKRRSAAFAGLEDSLASMTGFVAALKAQTMLAQTDFTPPELVAIEALYGKIRKVVLDEAGVIVDNKDVHARRCFAIFEAALAVMLKVIQSSRPTYEAMIDRAVAMKKASDRDT